MAPEYVLGMCGIAGILGGSGILNTSMDPWLVRDPALEGTPVLCLQAKFSLRPTTMEVSVIMLL